jgi:hypothetical protein
MLVELLPSETSDLTERIVAVSPTSTDGWADWSEPPSPPPPQAKSVAQVSAIAVRLMQGELKCNFFIGNSGKVGFDQLSDRGCRRKY